MIWKVWEMSKASLPTFMHTASSVLNLLHAEVNTRHESNPRISNTILEKTSLM